MAVVLPLVGGVDAHPGGEEGLVAPFGRGGDGHLFRFAIRQSRDGVELPAGEPQGPGALAFGKLQRQDAHADQIGAVDALVGFGEHRPHSQQGGALGGPVARGA